MERFSNCGEISNSFNPSWQVDLQHIIKNLYKHYEMWINARYFSNSDNSRNKSQCIPSFSATNSFLQNMQPQITRIAFTPIIPHPATDYDTIYIVMKNFQDVLLRNIISMVHSGVTKVFITWQKNCSFRIPLLFSNIFLGLGGFHMEKVIIA